MTTQAAEKRVYRSRNARVAGVCAGLADCFDFDPIVVRILAIFITALTLGLGVVTYIMLWVTLPLEPETGSLYEVTPESAESQSYGNVNCFTGRAVASKAEEHVSGLSIAVRIAVAAGLIVLFLLVATTLSPLMPGTEWWQFWPLGLLIVGLCLIIIPVPTRYETVWHALGIVVTSVAASLLPISLGTMSWSTIPVAFSQAWQLVVASTVLFIAGVRRDVDALVVGAAFLITGFCLFALTMCAQPGDLETLMLSMPDGNVIKISFLEG